MNKKMFVFDLDGTLLANNNEILPETISALKNVKSKGHILVIATGRPLIFTKEIIGIKIFDYLICNNGTYYLNQNTNKVYNNKFISEYIIDEMKDMCIKNKNVLFLHNATNCVMSGFTENIQLKKIIESQWNHMKTISFNNTFKFIDKGSITQSTILSTLKEAQIFKKELLKYKNEVEIKIVNKAYLDVNPKNVSKYSAILEISKDINVLNKNIIAFGDAENDLDMIINSGVGIAMGNALDELKNVANEVIGDNNKPSIANKLLKIIKEDNDWNS